MKKKIETSINYLIIILNYLSKRILNYSQLEIEDDIKLKKLKIKIKKRP